MFCAQLRCSPRGNRHHKIQFYSPSAGTRGRSAHSLTAPCYRPSPPTYAAGLISVMFAAFLPITFKASGTVVRPPTSVKPLPGRLIAEEPPVNGSTKCAYASESSETVPATPLSWAALPPRICDGPNISVQPQKIRQATCRDLSFSPLPNLPQQT